MDNKSCKAFFNLDESRVYFSGDFDGGNLERVEQLTPYVYRVYPGYDKESTRKTFFHFKVQGFRLCVVEFQVSRMHILQHTIKLSDASHEYHPVYRTATAPTYQKVPHPTRIYRNVQSEVQMAFSFEFREEGWVEFAFTYPYSYEDCRAFVEGMQVVYGDHPTIHYQREMICRTSQTRGILLMSISGRENLQRKAKVVMSGRVHPGETPSSYALEGVVRMLLDEQDPRAQALRRHFHFFILPMLNPQGVAAGMFRVDLNGDNLNRVYNAPHPIKHVGIWSVREWLNTLGEVHFMFDFHAHPSRKDFFIYGNAFEQFTQQVEAQLFSKVLESNNIYFEHSDCIYNTRSYQRVGNSKEGCARVYYHKRFLIVHSYTVECGYFAPTRPNTPNQEYTPTVYGMLGQSILLSLLDLFHLNPHPRTPAQRSVAVLRKQIAQRIYTDVERFRLVDCNCYKKVRGIQEYAEEYYRKKVGKYHLSSKKYQLKYKGDKIGILLKERSNEKIIEEQEEKQQSKVQIQCNNTNSNTISNTISNTTNSNTITPNINNSPIQNNASCQSTKLLQQLCSPKKNSPLIPFSTHLIHHQIYNHFQRYDRLNDGVGPGRMGRVHSNQKMVRLSDFNAEVAEKLKSSLTQNLYQHSLNKHLKLGRMLKIESELITNVQSKRQSKRKVDKQSSEKMFRINRIDSFLQREGNG